MRHLWTTSNLRGSSLPKGSIFIRGTRLRESQLQILMLCFVSWLPAAILVKRSTTACSEIDLSVDYSTNQSDAGCYHKRISPIRKQWNLLMQWKPPMPMLSPSRRLDQPSVSSSVNQTEAEIQGCLVTAVVAPCTYPLIVNLKRWHLTTMGRKAIYHWCAVLKQNSYNHPHNHQSLQDRAGVDIAYHVTHIACKK